MTVRESDVGQTGPPSSGAQRVAVRLHHLSTLLASLLFLPSAAALLVMLAVVTLGVTGRALTGSPFVANYEELSGYLLVAMVFFGLAQSFSSGGFVRVSVLHDRLRGRARLAADLALTLVGLAYVLTLTYHSWGLTLASRAFGLTAYGTLGAPLYLAQALMALGMTVFAAHLTLAAAASALLLAVRGPLPLEEKGGPPGAL